MKQINLKELIEVLHIRKGAQPVSIITQTVPPMNKGGRGRPENPYYDREKEEFRVFKRSFVNGMIGWSYTNAVANQRAREDHPDPDFEAQPRKWGERIPGSPLVKLVKGDTVSYYLELKVEKVVEEPLYYLDGELLDETNAKDLIVINDIKKWITPSRQAATQETEKEIILRDYALKNILSIKCSGVEYRVIL